MEPPGIGHGPIRGVRGACSSGLVGEVKWLG